MTLLLQILLSIPAWGYIPEYSMVLSRAAEQHGKGAYWIEQEVTFRRESEAFTVKESWLVVGEGAQRVTLEGKGPLKGLVQGTIVFQGPQKYFLEPTSPQVRSQRLGEDWLEPLFHFRSSAYLRKRMVNLGIVQSENERARVRLARVGGTVTWAIGTAPTQGEAPTLWLEQDQFIMRKLRSSNRTELRANDYAKYDEGLWFPRQRTYTFGTYSVEVQTLRVKYLGKKANDGSFKTSQLTVAKDGVKLPEVDGLREFYLRFR